MGPISGETVTGTGNAAGEPINPSVQVVET